VFSRRTLYLDCFFVNKEAPDDNLRATELVVSEVHEFLDTCGSGDVRALVDTVVVDEGVRVVFPKFCEMYAHLIADDRIAKVAFLGSNDFVASLVETIADLMVYPSKVKWFSDVGKAKS